MSDSLNDEFEDLLDNPMNFIDSLPEHMRPAALLSHEEADISIENAVNEVLRLYDELHGIVIRNEAIIRSRWANRNKSKKVAILKEVYPEIPEIHAPDVELCQDATHKYRDEDSMVKELNAKREIFLLAMLNIEDLTEIKGAKLLSLLHYRAHLFPSVFMTHDQEFLRFGIVVYALKRLFGPDRTVLCYGDRSTFGKVISWYDDNEEGIAGVSLEWRGDAIPVGDGLLVFEMQTKLLTFLINVCKKLLHDFDYVSVNPAPPLSPPPIPLSETTDCGWESVARKNTLEPYVHPERFSGEALVALVQAEYDEARDRLIELRTNPSYLAEQLRDAYGHRMEWLAKNKQPPKALLQERAAGTLMADAFTFYGLWTAIKEKVEDFQAKLGKYRKSIARAKDIPKEYNEAILDINALLDGFERIMRVRYAPTLMASEPMRQWFSTTYHDNRWGKNTITGQPPHGDVLLGLLLSLHREEDQKIEYMKRSQIYDQIDRFLNKHPDQRQRITPHVSRLLALRGSLADASDILDRHRPRFDVEGFDAIHQRTARLAGGYIVRDDSGAHLVQVGPLAFPLEKFSYPKGPKTLEWAHKCEQVDRAVDAFWTASFKQLRPGMDKKLYSMVEDLLRPYAENRAPWVDLVKRPGGPKRTTPINPDVLVTEIGATPVDTTKPQIKSKLKTRREKAVASEEKPFVSTEMNEEEVEKIAVSSKALHVLRMLFSDEEPIHAKGSVPWKDILKMFSDMEFSVTKLRGSAWGFSKGVMSFVCHEPHPEPNLDFWKARALGRRLTRRFGWTADTFVQTPR